VEGRKARIACPADTAATSSQPARRKLLDRACEDYVDAIRTLNADPDTEAEARENLARVDGALARLDARLRAVPVPPRLRALRAETRRTVRAMRDAVAELGSSFGSAFDAAATRIEGRGAQLDAALIRLGATCLDARPAPRRAQPPRRPGRLPPGTVES
jgi:phage shock protein A